MSSGQDFLRRLTDAKNIATVGQQLQQIATLGQK